MKNTAPSSVRSCCKNFRELPFLELPANQTKSVVIDRETPAFDFSEGTSRFAAYKLGQTPTGELRVKTFLVSGGLGVVPLVFYPAFTFLDADFAVVATIEPPFPYDSEKLPTGWVADVPIPSAARYVAIHTPHAKLGSSYSSGASLPANAAPVAAVLGGAVGVALVELLRTKEGAQAANAGKFEIVWLK